MNLSNSFSSHNKLRIYVFLRLYNVFITRIIIYIHSVSTSRFRDTAPSFIINLLEEGLKSPCEKLHKFSIIHSSELCEILASNTKNPIRFRKFCYHPFILCHTLKHNLLFTVCMNNMIDIGTYNKV